jgi:hypothetical protein
MRRETDQERAAHLKAHLAILRKRARSAEHPDAKAYHQIRISGAERELASIER